MHPSISLLPIDVITQQLCQVLDQQPAMTSVAFRYSGRATREELLGVKEIAQAHHLRFWLRFEELVLERREDPSSRLEVGDGSRLFAIRAGGEEQSQ